MTSSSSTSMEQLLVLYTVKNDNSTTHPNTFVLRAIRGKEVLLLDVLAQMPLSLGILYDFWVSDTLLNPKFLVLLQSPSSVVPVADGKIYLYLVPSHACVIVPLKQTLAYADASRAQIYGSSSYIAASEQTSTSVPSPLHNRKKTCRFVDRRRQQQQQQQQASLPQLQQENMVSPQFEKKVVPLLSADSGNTKHSKSPSLQTTTVVSSDPLSFDPFNLNDDDDDITASSVTCPPASVFNSSNSNGNRASENVLDGLGLEWADSDCTQQQGGIGDDVVWDAPAVSSPLPTNVVSAAWQQSKESKGLREHEHERTGRVVPSLSAALPSSDTTSSSSNASVAALAASHARNMFSFAVSTVQVVASASTAAVSKGTVAADLASAWGHAVGGQVGGLLAVVKVGGTKVRIAKELAQGGFGIVFLAQDAADNNNNSNNNNTEGSSKQYALKQMLCQTKEQVEEAQNELRALQRFAGHEHIISLLDHSSSSPSLTKGNRSTTVQFLFPFFALGTCWDCIERSFVDDRCWPFSERRALTVMRGVALALDFMHDRGQGFSHRDVKPHNVLLGGRGDHAVLTDLGSVTAARKQITSRQQALAAEDEAACKTSAAYRAPELTQAPQPPFLLDESVDIWGLGCTLYCLAFGLSPFESVKEGVLRLAILNGRFTFPAHYRNKDCQFSDRFADLISDMLKTSPGDRPTAAEVARRCDDLMKS